MAYCIRAEINNYHHRAKNTMKIWKQENNEEAVWRTPHAYRAYWNHSNINEKQRIKRNAFISTIYVL